MGMVEIQPLPTLIIRYWSSFDLIRQDKRYTAWYIPLQHTAREQAGQRIGQPVDWDILSISYLSASMSNHADMFSILLSHIPKDKLCLYHSFIYQRIMLSHIPKNQLQWIYLKASYVTKLPVPAY